MRDWTFKGDPILMYVASKSRPSRTGLTWTDAGRAWLNTQRKKGSKRRGLSARARIKKAKMRLR